MNRLTLAVTALAALAAPAFAQQQGATPPVGPDWTKVTVTTTDLGNRTYMLEGQGGNVTVAVGSDVSQVKLALTTEKDRRFPAWSVARVVIV